jgi:hypothetical protein
LGSDTARQILARLALLSRVTFSDRTIQSVGVARVLLVDSLGVFLVIEIVTVQISGLGIRLASRVGVRVVLRVVLFRRKYRDLFGAHHHPPFPPLAHELLGSFEPLHSRRAGDGELRVHARLKTGEPAFPGCTG